MAKPGRFSFGIWDVIGFLLLVAGIGYGLKTGQVVFAIAGIIAFVVCTVIDNITSKRGNR